MFKVPRYKLLALFTLFKSFTLLSPLLMNTGFTLLVYTIYTALHCLNTAYEQNVGVDGRVTGVE